MGFPVPPEYVDFRRSLGKAERLLEEAAVAARAGDRQRYDRAMAERDEVLARVEEIKRAYFY